MSNIVEFTDAGAIQKEAREWLIRLDGDEPLTAAEDARFRAWLARSPAHRAELQRLSRFWQSANVLTELAVPLHAARGHRMRPPLALAASVLLAVAVAAWWWFASLDVARGSFVTAIGEQRTVTLADGSSVRLNTDSQIQVSYEPTTRRVRLVRGEAFFQVATDRQRPFEVHTALGVVRAVGTAFIVRVDAARMDVAVSEGKVEVRTAHTEPRSASAASLSAGQTAEFAGERAPRIEQVSASELARRLSWHEGVLVFAGEPLSEVIAEVNRYSTTTIAIAEPQLESVAVGGRFGVGDLDAFIDVLETQFGIRAIRVDGDTIRLEAAR